jgi:DNA polymerase I
LRIAWDCETNGLLDEVTKFHCINAIDVDTGKEYRFNDHFHYPDSGIKNQRTGSIVDGAMFLLGATEWVYHNGIDYDEPVLRKLLKQFPEFAGKRHDTLTYARLIWTNIKDKDFALIRQGRLPIQFQQKGYIGSHSLAAWGYRLGEMKGEFDPANYLQDNGEPHTWTTVQFSKDMDDYCVQDVRVTVELFKLVESKRYAPQALQLEMDVAMIISRQQRHGFVFDVVGARRLTASLQVRLVELESKCIATFPPWYARDGKQFVPKRDNAKAGYCAGASLTKVKLMEFNPGSRDHIASRLMALYKWVPSEFTPEGKPKIDEEVMEALPYPEAKVLTEYLLVSKRLGQVAGGKEAWLNHVKPDGRIHGRVNSNGAVTGRMTHFKPNVAQTPKVGSPYGAECRALFGVPPGKKLVGCDAEGLELRIMAHYMAIYDKGAYAVAVVDGKKEDKTDAHSINQMAVKLNKRDNAKTFIYALIYGAGDHKLGSIVVDDMLPDVRDRFNAHYAPGAERDAGLVALGKRARSRIMDALPALKKLTDKVKKVAKEHGHLIGLDGRLIHVRSSHGALNALFQSGGAVVMKQALVFADRQVISQGLNSHWVANIHDEVQAETDAEHAESVGRISADAIRDAGVHFKLRCPLAGAYGVGDNWKETH